MTFSLPTQPGPRPPGFTPKAARGSGAAERKARNPAPEPAKKKPKREGVSPRLRAMVMERDHFACTLCGQTATPENPLHIGHIIAVARGGTNGEENLRTECQDCNLGGGARTRTTTPGHSVSVIESNEKVVSKLAEIVGKKTKRAKE